MTFTVTIKDKVGGKLIKKQDYSFFIKGGLKVDQSFGITLHGITDDEYALKTINGLDTIYAAYPKLDSITSINRVVKKQIIGDDSPSKYAIGLTTLTHLYYRLGCVSIGPEIGLTVDVFPQQRIRYMFGGSIMFRDGRHRISLDAGYLFGKYSALSNTQKVNDILDGADAMPNLIQKNTEALPLV